MQFLLIRWGTLSYISVLCSHDNEKYGRFWTEIVELACFPECNCLMSLFLLTSCYNVMSSLTSVICLDNRTTLCETLTKTQCIFCCEFILASQFHVDLIVRTGYGWIFREDLFSLILVLWIFYIFWFFFFCVVCSSASSLWVTECLPKLFDISNISNCLIFQIANKFPFVGT